VGNKTKLTQPPKNQPKWVRSCTTPPQNSKTPKTQFQKTKSNFGTFHKNPTNPQTPPTYPQKQKQKFHYFTRKASNPPKKLKTSPENQKNSKTQRPRIPGEPHIKRPIYNKTPKSPKNPQKHQIIQRKRRQFLHNSSPKNTTKTTSTKPSQKTKPHRYKTNQK
jgi:hypothetical protein